MDVLAVRIDMDVLAVRIDIFVVAIISRGLLQCYYLVYCFVPRAVLPESDTYINVPMARKRYKIVSFSFIIVISLLFHLQIVS